MTIHSNIRSTIARIGSILLSLTLNSCQTTTLVDPPSSWLPVELKVYDGEMINKYECLVNNVTGELGRCLPVIRFTVEPFCS